MTKNNSKLPVLSGKDVIKILSGKGFQFARQKESHIILVKIIQGEKIGNKTRQSIVVPNHKEIDKGTLLEIIRQSGLTREEFLK